MLIHDFYFESLASYYFVWKYYLSNLSVVAVQISNDSYRNFNFKGYHKKIIETHLQSV
jgi:hypothetical protein